MRFRPQDLAFVVPTKDRPREVKALLESLLSQSVRPGRVVIVDGGESIREMVESFRDRLKVDYLTCSPPGQIRQRLKGLSVIGDETRLVGFLDDDILFHEGAIETLLAFWNRAPAETGGVSFNLVNIAPHRFSKLRSLLGMSGIPGQVLSSGYNISVVNQEHDIRTQWLPGGCTVWRLDVVRKFPQEELNTRWAAGEDVRFSYPIGKHHPLFVCAAAKVVDTGQTTILPAPERAKFQGRKECLAYAYLVELHPELSKVRCLWMVASSSVLLFLKAVIFRNRSIHRALGQTVAFGEILSATLTGKSLKSALED